MFCKEQTIFAIWASRSMSAEKAADFWPLPGVGVESGREAAACREREEGSGVYEGEASAKSQSHPASKLFSSSP